MVAAFVGLVEHEPALGVGVGLTGGGIGWLVRSAGLPTSQVLHPAGEPPVPLPARLSLAAACSRSGSGPTRFPLRWASPSPWGASGQLLIAGAAPM